jgi:hypothetical protein
MVQTRIRILYVFLLIFLAVLCVIFFACADTVNGPVNSEILLNNPTYITWTDKEEELEGYKADVEVYTMNSRRDTGASLVDGYTISMKKIDGKMYTRLDTKPDTQGRLRSVVSNGAEIILFDTTTNAVELRTTVANQIPQDLDFFNGEAMLSKVNLSLIRSEAQRLSFDLKEDTPGGLTLELPSRLFPQNVYENRISTKAVFDVEKELLNHVEVVTIMENGFRRTSTSYPVYEEFNNTYIKTGMVTIVENKAPNLLEGLGNVKIYNSPDDYPTISKEEYDKLSKKGLAFPGGDMFFGDPADLSYTETIIEVYQNVEINTVQNSVFRIPGGF